LFGFTFLSRKTILKHLKTHGFPATKRLKSTDKEVLDLTEVAAGVLAAVAALIALDFFVASAFALVQWQEIIETNGSKKSGYIYADI